MTTTQNTTTTLFGTPYRERLAKNGEYGDECVVCGRRIRANMLYVNADGGPEWFGDDMGWHPIGSDCAKKATKAGWEVTALGSIQ